MKELILFLRPTTVHWRWMLAGVLLSLLVIAANTALMAISGWFIASMAVAGISKVAFNYFFASVSIRALAILRTIGRYGERLITHEAAFHLLASLRVWLFNRLIPIAPAGLEGYASGDLAGRLRADLDSLESVYLRIVAPVFTGVIAISLSVLFVAIWNTRAALGLAAILFLAGLLLPMAGRKMAEKPGRYATELAGELRTKVTEGLQGAEELLLLGVADRHAAAVEALSAGLIKQQIRLGLINSLILAGVTSCSGMALVIIALACIPAVHSGQLAGPSLVMLFLFVAASFEAVGPLASSLQLIPATAESIRRIRELTDTEIMVQESLQCVVPESSSIAFNQVSFSYGDGTAVFERFTMHLNPGERVALVGESGSGKSTLIELLLRFRICQGSISIGGFELADISQETLSELIAAVPQKPHLFNSTILENIMLGRKIEQQKLAAVLHDCCLDEWISGLPQGLDTRVGEGGNAVSGGEARRIALARALIVQTPILLMDEPTEGLDSVTEQTVVERLGKRLEGKTVLVATHRPTCLRLADRVVRLEKLQAYTGETP